MKKNLISVLILALLVVNLVMTAILTITILPETKKSNELITRVCSAIDLELQSGEKEDVSSIPTKNESKIWQSLDNVKGSNRKTSGQGKDKKFYEWDNTHNDIEVYDIPDSMTINLKQGADGKDHYAVISVSLSLNKGNEDYSTYQPTLEAKQSLIKSTINTVVSQYTYDEIKTDQQQVQDAILDELHNLFESDFIVSVGFSSATYQ